MKKIFSVLLCTVMLLSGMNFAFANDTLEFDARLIRVETDDDINQFLVVEGSKPGATGSLRVTLSVLRDGMTLKTPLSEEVTFEKKYAALHQGYTENGSYSFNIPFDEDEGKYTVYVNIGGIIGSSEIICYPVDTLVGLLKELNEKTATVAYVSEILINNGDELGVDTSILKLLSEETVKQIAYDIISDDLEVYNIENLNSILENKIPLEGMTNKNTFEAKSSIIEKYNGDLLRLDESVIWEKYQEMSEEQKYSALSYADGKEAENEQRIRELFEDGIAYQSFKELDNYSQVEAYFDEYSEVLENAKVTAFKAMSDKERSTIAVHIIKNRSKIRTVEEIENLLNTDIKNISSLLGQNSASHGGGGGGGGGRVSADKEISVKEEKPQTKPELTEPVKPQTTGFSDISDVEWAKASILQLLEKNVVNGKEINRFAPHDYVKRSEFTKMIAEAFGYKKEKAHGFADVAMNHWASDYISAVAGAGIITGDDKGNFNPDADITRQDIAAILYRVLVLENYKFNIESVSIRFNDKADISEYAENGIAVLSHMEILNGYDDGSVKPRDNATRAEVAVLLCRVMNILEGEV